MNFPSDMKIFTGLMDIYINCFLICSVKWSANSPELNAYLCNKGSKHISHLCRADPLRDHSNARSVTRGLATSKWSSSPVLATDDWGRSSLAFRSPAYSRRNVPASIGAGRILKVEGHSGGSNYFGAKRLKKFLVPPPPTFQLCPPNFWWN